MSPADAAARDQFPIVDPHQHFWDLGRNYHPWLCDPVPIAFRYGDYSAIKRNYLPADYRRDAGRYRIVKTVHIEAEWNRADPVGETRWIETIHREFGLPSACIGYAQLDRPNVEQVLAGHARSPLVRGIRHKPNAARNPRDARRGEPGSMDDPRWRAGFSLLERFGFSCIDATAELAADFPATQIIINHTGLPPDRSADALSAWRRALETVAAKENVAIKISGLGRPGLPWTLEANGPIIRDTIAIFGVERCMFASNYPVDRLAGAFDTIYEGFFAAIADHEQRKLFHDNAVRIYRL